MCRVLVAAGRPEGVQLLTSDEISQLPDLSVGEVMACGTFSQLLCCALLQCLHKLDWTLQMSYWRATAKKQYSGRPPCTKGFTRRENAGRPEFGMAVG